MMIGALLVTGAYMMASSGGATADWLHAASQTFQASKTYVMQLMEDTNTPILRIGVIFILGLLMSLTPCIYPMIPITLGTLQAAAGSARNNTFILALLYTCGIAITFAILGLLAAFGGAQLGTLLGNPWFIIPFVTFLGYLAYAMIGLYELHIPRFLQNQTAVSRSGGAYVSAFVFGMLNGTVASPCVSPGLVMVLSIVAAQQSSILGFIYLFTFGFGLGVPLLIIGSFSNASKIMPQAGTWMLEVKRLFGILLLSMAWYYISNIVTAASGLWIAAALAMSIVLIYTRILMAGTGTYHRIWCGVMICAALALSGLAVTYIFVAPSEDTTIEIWHDQYQEAREQARKNNGFLMIDFGASWCSSCRTIEKQLLHSPELQKDNLVHLKIDCTNPNAPYVQNMMQKFEIKQGVPVILLVEPSNETVLARWGGELIDYTPNDLLYELEQNGI